MLEPPPGQAVRRRQFPDEARRSDLRQLLFAFHRRAMMQPRQQQGRCERKPQPVRRFKMWV